MFHQLICCKMSEWQYILQMVRMDSTLGFKEQQFAWRLNVTASWTFLFWVQECVFLFSAARQLRRGKMHTRRALSEPRTDF